MRRSPPPRLMPSPNPFRGENEVEEETTAANAAATAEGEPVLAEGPPLFLVGLSLLLEVEEGGGGTNVPLSALTSRPPSLSRPPPRLPRDA
jgi:hypothetical protein